MTPVYLQRAEPGEQRLVFVEQRVEIKAEASGGERALLYDIIYTYIYSINIFVIYINILYIYKYINIC